MRNYEKEYRALDVLLESTELPGSRFSRNPGALAEMLASAEHLRPAHFPGPSTTFMQYSVHLFGICETCESAKPFTGYL